MELSAPAAAAELVAVFRPIGAGLAAGLFGVAGPLLWERLRGAAPGWRRQVVFAALGFVFWRDFFHFAMADLPGTLCLLLALVVVLHRRPSLVTAGAAGLLLAAAINMRPVFGVAAGPLVVGAAYGWWREAGAHPSRPAALLAALGLGAAVVLAPQWRINQRRFGQPTPLVLGWAAAQQPRSVYLDQLAWGLQMQQFGGSVAPGLDGRMEYADPVGSAILRRANRLEQEAAFTSVGDYLRVVAPHWPTMVPLYGRHLFNGLNVQQPSLVMRPFGWASLVVAGLNYSVLFAAGLVLLGGRLQLDRWRTSVTALALLLPCAAVIPTAIEVRYLLPLHLLLYGLVAFGWPARWTPRYGWQARWRAPVLLAYGGWLVGCFWLSASVHAHLRGWPPLWPL